MRNKLIVVSLLSSFAALGMWIVDGVEVQTSESTPSAPVELSVRFNDTGNSAIWYILANNVLYRYEDVSSWINSRVTLYDVTYCDNPFPFSVEEMQAWSVENISGQFTIGQPNYSKQWGEYEYNIIEAVFDGSGDLIVQYREGETTVSWARYRYVSTPYGMGYEGYASSMGDPPYTSGYIIQFTGMNYQTNITESVKVTQ